MRAAVAGLPVRDTACFERDFDLVGVQRHPKVLGIFARLHHRDGKPRYLADAPRLLGYLAGVLPRYPQLDPLRTINDPPVPPSLAGRTPSCPRATPPPAIPPMRIARPPAPRPGPALREGG